MKLSIKVAYAFTLILILLLGGTIYFNWEEGWSYVDSFYFSTMTLTTVGYGDFVPTTDASKIFVSFYSIIGIGIMLFTLTSIIGEYWFKQEKRIENVFTRWKKRRKKK
jgi:voltage-gated potassium channel